MPSSPPPPPASPAATTKPSTAAISQFVPRPTTTTQTFLPEFWSHIIRNAEEYQSDFKDGQLPLARIKKLVKSDPDIKMIANEVTVLLDKASEIFINEITVRAFLVANSLNRRTVNTSDVAMAVSQSDMFDFLIDIVPTDQLPSEGDQAANSPAPSTAPKNSRRRQLTVPETSEDADKTETIVSTPLLSACPPFPPKKKAKSNRVNRNLLPEEVAVPIPDTELIKREPSPDIAPPRRPNEQSLAIPLSASDLRAPGTSKKTWELAIPITSNSQQSFDLPSTCAKTWEMAVPITDSSVATSTDRRPPLHHSSHHRKPNWEFAVPIVDENHQDSGNSSLENQQGLKIDSRPNQRSWELAVPIEPDPRRHEDPIPAPSTSSHQSGALETVPIDPALLDPAPPNSPSAPIIPHPLLPDCDKRSNGQIKQEE